MESETSIRKRRRALTLKIDKLKGHGGGLSKTRREFIQATGSMALAAALASKLPLS